MPWLAFLIVGVASFAGPELSSTLEALRALGVPALVGDQVKLLADAKEVSRHYVQHLKHYVQHLKYF